MRDSFFLAARYLRHHRLTSAVLVASITLIIYLPAALEVIVSSAEQHLSSRADSTPLVIGPRGSALELVLASIYFNQSYDDVMRLKAMHRVNEQQLGTTIPLHLRYRARDCPIVGTTEEYMRTRDLRVDEGRMWEMLGECVLGARVASRLGLTVGDRVPVSTSSPFSLDNPPLRLRVVGVLAASESPDDEAIFVELETTWIIDGLGHGHAAEAPHGSPEARSHTDITKENVDSFHFHGKRDQFPVSAIVVVPNDDRAETILLGQYFSADETMQIVRPRKVIEGLLQSVLMVRSYIIAVIAVVSFVTVLMLILVFVLSVRLRRAEIVTISKMGGSRYIVASILGSQITIILGISVALSAVLTIVTKGYGRELVKLLVL